MTQAEMLKQRIDRLFEFRNPKPRPVFIIHYDCPFCGSDGMCEHYCRKCRAYVELTVDNLCNECREPNNGLSEGFRVHRR